MRFGLWLEIKSLPKVLELVQPLDFYGGFKGKM